WNGDGIRDILVINGSFLDVYLSAGTQFSTTPIHSSIPYSTSNLYRAAPNAVGDGLDALFSYPIANTQGLVQYYLHSGSGNPSDLATSFSDGFGMTYSPTYVSIARNNYSKGSGAPNGEYDYQGPLFVVDQFTASDGTGSTYQQQFWYYY